MTTFHQADPKYVVVHSEHDSPMLLSARIDALLSELRQSSAGYYHHVIRCIFVRCAMERDIPSVAGQGT